MKTKYSIVLIIITAALTYGASSPKPKKERSSPIWPMDNGTAIPVNKMWLIEFEGCQYVYAESHAGMPYAMALVHHGACNNPIHQHSQ